MRISDWSSDVCSSDLHITSAGTLHYFGGNEICMGGCRDPARAIAFRAVRDSGLPIHIERLHIRSEEHTSELQSLMRISYAVFCLKKKTKNNMQYYTTATKQDHRNTSHNHYKCTI